MEIGFLSLENLILNLHFNLSRKAINYYLTLLPYFICVTKILRSNSGSGLTTGIFQRRVSQLSNAIPSTASYHNLSLVDLTPGKWGIMGG
jgi:hypothetical protein